jgi:hypothetical protein
MLAILRAAIAACSMVFMAFDLRLSFGKRVALQRVDRLVDRNTSMEHRDIAWISLLKLAHTEKGGGTRN